MGKTLDNRCPKGCDSTPDTITEDRFIIDTMVWSFSRLSTYRRCPYCFYLKYVLCEEDEPDFFGQYGRFMHEILEKYERGELSLFDISGYYEENFLENVSCDAPDNPYVDIKQSYYDKGLDYLNNIDLILDKYEVLGIEKEVTTTIGNHQLIGFIDLLLKDKATGDITVLDHKSASIKFKKNGEIRKADLEHVEDFKRQLYLYSKSVIEEYGVEPKYLSWNLFNEQRWLTIDFNREEYDAALKWAADTIAMIEQETVWLPTPSRYFCQNTCDMRAYICEYVPD